MATSPLPPAASEAWAEQLTTSLRAQRDRTRDFLATQQRRLEQATTFVEQQLQRLEEECKAERDECNRLRVARDALETRLAQAESNRAEVAKRLAESTDDEAHLAADEELQQRFTTASEELRQARNKNADLQQELAKARSAASKLAHQVQEPGKVSWEYEKQRILAALEADTNNDDEVQKAERLGILEVLRTTDEVIAARDRDIEELKERVAALDPNTTTVRDAASVEQTLDQDAVIREERERLQRLQEECQEKLRQAEVDLALERAKLARQRAEFEIHLSTKPDATSQESDATDAVEQKERSTRGRWLARLGLTTNDIQSPKNLQ